MQRAIHVRVRESHHHLLPFRVGVSFENVSGFPFVLPFLLDFLGLAHETFD
jgi:hypothetical protein